MLMWVESGIIYSLYCSCVHIVWSRLHAHKYTYVHGGKRTWLYAALSTLLSAVSAISGVMVTALALCPVRISIIESVNACSRMYISLYNY